MQVKTRKSRWFTLFLALGLGAGMLATLLAVPWIGPAEPAAAALAPIAAQGPILGGWRTYRSDNVDNRASAVAYNSVRDEYLVVWEDHNATEIAIYARRVASDGYEIGGAIQGHQPAGKQQTARDPWAAELRQPVQRSLPDGAYPILSETLSGRSLNALLLHLYFSHCSSFR